MTARLHDKIRHILESTPQLTQRGLAERMGLNPAAVNRMLYGQRNIMAEEIPVIEDYLGQSLIEYRQDTRAAPPRGFSDVSQQAGFAGDISTSTTVPVYRFSSTGRETVDWAARHPAQIGIRDCFAFYVPTDNMTPRYYKGELVYIHPGRPPEVNRDCFIEMRDGTGLVYRLLRQKEEKLRVQVFHPAGEKDIAIKDIRHVYAVIGRN